VIALRPVQLPADRAALLALGRSFTTELVYRVERTADGFVLAEASVAPPLRKTFPLADDLGAERAWRHGVVAEADGELVGFAAYTFQQWNQRAELWHLYVAPHMRGHAVGRQLVNEVVERARRAGMRCVWLETSNVAYPAIQFYRSLGFELCGLDTSLYAGEQTGEIALYFMLPLAEP
jgi:ribosomal protein S18 acetylase RimI-like enzyme